MKRTLVFCLLFLLFLSTKAQVNNLKRSIQWKSTKEISHYYEISQKNMDTKKFLFFDNANYYNHNTLLPYYFELIKVNNSNTRIKIINQQYKPLTRNELNFLSYPDSIPGKLFYEFTINYSRNRPYLQLNLLPLRQNPSNKQFEKLIAFEIELVTESTGVFESEKQNNKSFSNQSVLSNGSWVKIKIKDDGIYQITYSELLEMGISNPSVLKIYGNSSGMLPLSNTDDCQDDLIQNAIFFEKGNDGVFNKGDYILFYAKGPDQLEYNKTDNFYNWTRHIYSNDNYFFLTTDVGSVGIINNINSSTQPINETVTTFTDHIHYEKDLRNLLESGQLWFGEQFDISTSYAFDFEINNLIKTEPINAKIALAARSSGNTTFTIKTGNQTIANPEYAAVNMSSYTSAHAIRKIIDGNFTSNNDDFTINIDYHKSSSSSMAWLDFITLNAQRQLKMTDAQLQFRYYNDDDFTKTVDFRIQNTTTSTKVWNVTNTTKPQNLEIQSAGSGTISVKVNVNPGLNEFVAFDDGSFLTTEYVSDVPNQNLHAINHQDMIIVTHPDFMSQAQSIAELHTAQDRLSIVITTPEQIFNEFSSGTPDVAAIRNFVRMIYQRPSATDTLKYLLFIGDGSFDHKSITANNINFVMTYQSKNSLNPVSSFVTDDFFGLLDATDHIESSNSGLVDIGIGRLPVKSSDEAQNMANKIYNYTDNNNKGDWINSLCFIGDDEDNNIHMRDADRLATFVDTVYPHFFINKIYLDAYPQERSATSESYPEVNRIINEQVNNGILIFNYTGHGSENKLAHENILTIANINTWKNKNKLAVFITATCEFSRFDNHKYESAGERVLLNPNGGGIALFSTTRLVYASLNYILNKNFYNFVFKKNDKNNYYALGDIMRLAKNASGTGNNKRNFSLLGDPVLKLPLAHLNVITDSINHKDVNYYTDTLKALSKVTVHGHISDPIKNVVTNYNGVVYPMVLDKKRTITTLANDGGIPMEFEAQNNILYKGKASVVNGLFQYTFVVPKDISYNFDNGKISYYSLSSNSDAKGYFNNFIIGGTDNTARIDNNGPAIKLYMNDENFVSGGVTDENPVLYAILTDSSGINTVGSGIGHNITAVLDNNTSNIIVLNDYYEADIDDYQKGKIEYLFNKMEEGEHQLKLKVWDVYNNSSEEYLDFLVAESEELAIRNLLNYPNPFTERTAFYFDHNRPNENLEVMIQVFTVTGKLVKTIYSTINSNGFRSEPIYWNGLDDFGDTIGRGVYLYQIKIRTIDGETVTKIEKLVILK